MNLIINPHLLSGAVTSPPSKSIAHRAILCAALADGTSILENIDLSRDIRTTIHCVEELGAVCVFSDGVLKIRGMGGQVSTGALPHFDCGESGSTLRFLIPLALVLRGGGIFTGCTSLTKRPMEPYFAMFRDQGIRYSIDGHVLTVEGQLHPGKFLLPGHISSQFFTGLLLALPLLDAPSEIRSASNLESRQYVSMTLDMLKRAGVDAVERSISCFHTDPLQKYKPLHMRIEGDWSQAAFWYAANAVGCGINIQGLTRPTLQADAHAIETMAWLCPPGGDPSVRSLDMAPCPDVVLPLAAWAAPLDGFTIFKNCNRLQYKECNRLNAIGDVINALGGEVHINGGEIAVIGKKDGLEGGVTIDCRGDHRVAMMTAILAIRCRKPVVLLGAACVDKSYPNFWRDYKALGGDVREYTGT